MKELFQIWYDINKDTEDIEVQNLFILIINMKIRNS